MSSPGKVTWGCHSVAMKLTQTNTSVEQTYFQIFNIKRYMYYVFLTIRICILYKKHWWSLVLSWQGDI